VVALADACTEYRKIIPLLPTKNITMETININYQTEGSLIISEDSYEPPRIEVVEVSVEKGFADSTSDFGDGGTW